ncbi:MAG: MFS transporter [Alphaproteobacteria bacterium]|nr:MFS transporter [Alphaproteobacteria bacterium]
MSTLSFSRAEARALGVVSTGHLVAHFYVLVLPPIYPLLKQEFSVSYAELGLTATAYAIVSGIGQTPVGFLVDRIGGRRLLITGLILMGLAIAAIGFTSSFWPLVFFYALAGAGNTVFHPANYAILSGSIPRERIGRAFSIHTFIGHIGWAIAPGIVIGLTALWNWRTALVIVGLAGVATAGLVAWQGAALKEESATVGSNDRAASSIREGVALLMSPAILLAFVFFAMIAMGFGALRQFTVSALVVGWDMPLGAANGVLTGYLIGSPIGILVGGLFVDRLERPQLIAAGGFLGGAALALMIGSLPLSLTVLTAALAAAGICGGMVQPARDLLLRRMTPEGSAGKVFGFATTGLGFGGALMPPLFGWILDQGDPRWVFWLAAAFLLASLLTIGRFGRAASAARLRDQPSE